MKGFTLIELMIVLAILGILAAILFNAVAGHNTMSYGYNGAVEVRCIDGYKVMVSAGYGRYGGTSVSQEVDANGHPIPCEAHK